MNSFCQNPEFELKESKNCLNNADEFPAVSKSSKISMSIFKKFFSDQPLDETFSKIKLAHRKEDSYAEVMKKIINVDELSQKLKFDERVRILDKEKAKLMQKQNLNKSKKSKMYSNSSSKSPKVFNLPKIKMNPIALRYHNVDDKRLVSMNMNINVNMNLKNAKTESNVEKYHPNKEKSFLIKEKTQKNEKTRKLENNFLKNLSASSKSIKFFSKKNILIHLN
jgi:hypothetical protein